MANSQAVSSGDQATAAQYNNLRLDVYDATTGHDHSGTDNGRTLSNPVDEHLVYVGFGEGEGVG